MPVRSFWLPDNQLETFTEFKKCLANNGLTLGSFIVSQMVDYVARFGDSEQTNLTTFSDDQKKKIADIHKEIRHYYLVKAQAGQPIRYLDIVASARNRISNVKLALEIVKKIEEYLRENGGYRVSR